MMLPLCIRWFSKRSS